MTMKITRNATTKQSNAMMAPKGNGKVKSASSVTMYAKTPAPDGLAELAPTKAKRAIKAAPVVDSALEIRINALASMIRGLNDTIETLVSDNALLRADIAALTAPAPVVVAPVVSAPAPAPALVAGDIFELSAKAAIANYHAGFVNEKILDAASRMGKGITARCYLKTAENRAFKTACKEMGLSLHEADANLDKMVFDA